MSDETEKNLLLIINMNAVTAVNVEMTPEGTMVTPIGANALNPLMRVGVSELDMTEAMLEAKMNDVFPGERNYEKWVELIGYSAAVQYIEQVLIGMRANLERLVGKTIIEPAEAPPAPPKAQA